MIINSNKATNIGWLYLLRLIGAYWRPELVHNRQQKEKRLNIQSLTP